MMQKMLFTLSIFTKKRYGAQRTTENHRGPKRIIENNRGSKRTTENNESLRMNTLCNSFLSVVLCDRNKPESAPKSIYSPPRHEDSKMHKI
jgi:hypothetical protein